MIRGWWDTWKRARPTSIGGVLQDLERGSSAVRPTGALLDWLRDNSWEGEWLQPREAGAWLLIWSQERARERAGRLPAWQRGPTTRRPALADHYRIGRATFGRLPPIQGVRDTTGTLQTDPNRMEEVLWQSRADIWATAPPGPACGEALLRAYFAHRPALGNVTPPTWDQLLAAVLNPGGSAPGHDGIPYEAFHHGARFVACLLGQAFHAAALSPRALEITLGPSLDILVWILKVPGGETPAEMRPLQLPTCFRRLFGAALDRKSTRLNSSHSSVSRMPSSA